MVSAGARGVFATRAKVRAERDKPSTSTFALASARSPAQESLVQMADRSPRIPAAAPSVLGTWTLTVVRALDARGVDGRAVAARAGIDVTAFDDPDSRHPIAATTRLWRLAVEATHDPCFGLWASRFVSQTTFHALGFAVFASRTLREAFERFVRYGRLVSDAAEIELIDADEHGLFRLVLPQGPGRPADESIDAILSLLARTAWMLSSGKVTPAAVRLERPEPSPSEPFSKVFRAPVRFQERENVLAYSARALDERLPTGNAELARHNDEVVTRHLARIERVRVSTRLRRWFIDQLSAGEPAEEAAARSLGMSLRNLQRRLREEGTTYREALEEVRREMARSYLNEGHSSVTEIAFLLGFADTSTFSRAFRRWTGLSPRAYAQDRVRTRSKAS
jgi:AraC-like DNA-binding protein